jgi:hypothetical protein
MEEIHRALENPAISAGVKSLIRWQFRLHDPGDFYHELWALIRVADDKNLARLMSAYPDEVMAYIEWTRGDLRERLAEMGLNI